jgi:hypothetical protein
MGFTYVIGVFCQWVVENGSTTDHRVTEHMEEDEATPSSLPPWVELEYSVSLAASAPLIEPQPTIIDDNRYHSTW